MGMDRYTIFLYLSSSSRTAAACSARVATMLRAAHVLSGQQTELRSLTRPRPRSCCNDSFVLRRVLLLGVNGRQPEAQKRCAKVASWP